MSPTCECGIPYVVIAKVWYSRHDLLGKHWAYMRSKGKIKPRKADKQAPEIELAVSALMTLGHNKTEAKRMVVEPEPDEAALVKAILEQSGAVKGGTDGQD